MTHSLLFMVRTAQVGMVLALFAQWFKAWRDRKACPFCGAGWGSDHRSDCYMHEDPPKG